MKDIFSHKTPLVCRGKHTGTDGLGQDQGVARPCPFIGYEIFWMYNASHREPILRLFILYTMASNHYSPCLVDLVYASTQDLFQNG